MSFLHIPKDLAGILRYASLLEMAKFPASLSCLRRAVVKRNLFSQVHMNAWVPGPNLPYPYLSTSGPEGFRKQASMVVPRMEGSNPLGHTLCRAL